MKSLYLFEDKDEILNEVNRITNYEGTKALKATKDALQESNGTTYTQISTADADAEVLDGYFEETATAVSNKLDYYIESIAISVDSPINYKVADATKDTGYVEKSGVGVAYTFRMPSNYEDTVISLVKKNLKWAIVNGIVGSWFAVSFPSKSEYYLNKSEALIIATRDLLFRRFRPTARVSDKDERSSVSLNVNEE